ncbi:MAG: orotate phosphoribosyltransferase [candidate division Zixibacteria bacterium]|nr:orotate phosphoribosyltransferase [candidate division Zixibacteria bacterium]
MTLTGAEARERLRVGLNRLAVKRGRFVLASGAVSDYYVNVKEICLRGEYLRLIGALLWERIKPSRSDAVGGMTLGADPIVAAVAIAAAEDGCDCPALIVRREAKDHGTGQRIEGPFQAGMRVAIVEDVTTTGSSAGAAADAIIAAGGSISGVFTVLNRAAGADNLFAERGWPFQALFGVEDLEL